MIQGSMAYNSKNNYSSLCRMIDSNAKINPREFILMMISTYL